MINKTLPLWDAEQRNRLIVNNKIKSGRNFDKNALKQTSF
jgi:hypothetical protein